MVGVASRVGGSAEVLGEFKIRNQFKFWLHMARRALVQEGAIPPT